MKPTAPAPLPEFTPERFADRSRSEKAAHFDAANQRIRFSNNAPDAELRPGAQDRLPRRQGPGQAQPLTAALSRRHGRRR